jgi:hypothetical protein
VLALVLAALAGCSGKGPVGGYDVLVVGDSLMAQSADVVTEELRADGWEPFVAAKGGIGIVDWFDDLGPLAEQVRPDIAVVELGTNDCCRDLGTFIDTTVEGLLAAGVEAIVWLDTQEVGFRPDAGRVNRALEAADERWEELYVVSMNDRLASTPEYHEEDGLHLSPEGERELARFIREELAPFRPDA